MKQIALNSNQLGLFRPEPEPWKRPEFLPDWRACPLLSLDLETKDDGLNSGIGAGWAFKDHGYITGFSVCNGEKTLYFPLRHPESDNFDVSAGHRWLAAHVARPNGRTIFHHANYDVGWIYRETGTLCTDPVCTMIMGTMYDENRRSVSLENLCRDFGIPGKDKRALNEAAAAYGVHPQKEMYKLPARYVGAYGEADAIAPWHLYNIMMPELEKQDLQRATQLEFDLIAVLMLMRYRGIRINHDKLDQLRSTYNLKRDAILDEMTRTIPVGRHITMDDIMSPKTLAGIFDTYGYPYPFTRTGLPSFESDWLEAQDNWLPKVVALAKKLDQASDKFLTTYIEDFTIDGRVHSEIHQLRDGEGGTKSYRLSMSKPPLQQITANDEELGKELRTVFEPEEGEEWVVGDYSQQEPRLTVHYASALKIQGWEKAAAYYRDNPEADYHQMVVDMTGYPRPRSKILNLSLSYGLGLNGLALKLKVPLEEAKEIMVHYHNELPFIKGLTKVCQRAVNEKGYLRLIDGARCRFDLWRPRDDWYGPAFPYDIAKQKWPNDIIARADTRKAMNRLIQGSAARQTKKAMVDCYRAGHVPLLQMHDDLNFSLGDRAPVKEIHRIMVEAIPLSVPMKVDIEIGPSWGDAKEIKGETLEGLLS
jgi:DNA polymerase I-like protein with 3'-5' exonuclease and polymerase domains